MRLVDADEIKKMFDPETWQGEMMIAITDTLPTVEAVPVVHGEWIDNGEKDVYGISKPFAISCSICGSSAGTSWMSFCPNCGADMRKKVQ